MAKADWRAREPKADDQKKKFDKLINQDFVLQLSKIWTLLRMSVHILKSRMMGLHYLRQR